MTDPAAADLRALLLQMRDNRIREGKARLGEAALIGRMLGLRNPVPTVSVSAETVSVSLLRSDLTTDAS